MNKTVPQLMKEIENLDLSTHDGADGSRRRIVHPRKSKLLAKLRKDNKTMTYVEEYVNGDYKLLIAHDEFAESPREYCNQFRFVASGKYSVYNDDSITPEELVKCNKHNDYLIFPVYCYEHGGVSFNLTGFHCPWDSGQIGFMYRSKLGIYNDYDVKRISPKLKEKLRKNAEAELQELEDYVMGNTFLYELYKDEEELDSCAGFLGYDHEKNGLFEHVLECSDVQFKAEHMVWG